MKISFELGKYIKDVSGNVSGNFPIDSFDIDDINVSVFGLVYYYENYFDGYCCVDFEMMRNSVESAVSEFIKYLKKTNDCAFEQIDFFGDVQIRNGQIVSFPIYFIKVNKKCQLLKIHGIKLTEIEIECIDENEDYDELINSLERIDPNILAYYYGAGEYDDYDGENDDYDDEYDDYDDEYDDYDDDYDDEYDDYGDDYDDDLE